MAGDALLDHLFGGETEMRRRDGYGGGGCCGGSETEPAAVYGWVRSVFYRLMGFRVSSVRLPLPSDPIRGRRAERETFHWPSVSTSAGGSSVSTSAGSSSAAHGSAGSPGHGSAVHGSTGTMATSGALTYGVDAGRSDVL